MFIFRSLWARILYGAFLPILLLLTPFYLVGYAIHRGLARARKIRGVAVIAIGNLTVGGTGKTPVAIALARMIVRKYGRCAVILRGYKRKGKGTLIVSDGKKIHATVYSAGDEAILIAQALLPYRVPVLVDADRARAISIALEKFHIEIAILDDALSHHRIQKDLSLILIDASTPPRPNWVLPAGPYRMPLRSLRQYRQGLILLTKSNIDPNRTGRWTTRLRAYRNRLWECPLVIDGIYDLTGARRSFRDFQTEIKDRPLLAFCGIGNPYAFFRLLQGKVPLAQTIAFPDHFAYHEKTVKQIANRWHHAITTEKDFVKIKPILQKQPQWAHAFNLYWMKVQIDLPEEVFSTIIDILPNQINVQ